MSTENPKRVPSAKVIANLQRGGSSGAKKHTRNKRPLTQKERLFCFFYVQLGSAKKAAELAGCHPQAGQYFLKQPHIQAFLPKAEEKMLDEAVKFVSEKIHVSVELLDRELIKAVKQKNGHVKNEALELGYQRAGIIERKGTTNVSATANAGAAALSQNATMKEVIYKSRWLRNNEDTVYDQIASEYKPGTQPAAQPVKSNHEQPLLSGNTKA